MAEDYIQELCLKCGMCCNGVIFADVRLQSVRESARVSALGLPISTPRSTANAPRLNQPCSAFKDCRCTIYDDRPSYCRKFECALLKSVGAGEEDIGTALRIIRKTHRSAEKVRVLLRELGNNDETLALNKRFQRVMKKFQSDGVDPVSADLFGQLTIVMHELNVLLSEHFYPGQS